MGREPSVDDHPARRVKLFIGMETSGVLRRGASLAGHDVVSCDLLSAEDDAQIGRHIVGDVFEALFLHACHVENIQLWHDFF